MSKEHRKYVREQKAYADKQQTTFDILGKLKPSQMQQAKTVVDIKTDQIVACAYCLWQGALYKFLIKTKKGYHQSQAQCPSCGNKQLIRTLTTDMTPEEYAEWMYSNMQYGGWSKVPFTKWKERLAELGWSQRFWLKYRQLKGEETQETEEEYIQRKQQEEWNEQGVQEE